MPTHRPSLRRPSIGVSVSPADQGGFHGRKSETPDWPGGPPESGEVDGGDVEVVRDPLVIAGRLFGSAFPKAREYAARLVTTGIAHGLVGPKEASRIWERHLLNCVVVAPTIAPHAQIADLGSGAGLPGIVLALARPDLTVHLVEPLHRRVVWLRDTGQLGCPDPVVTATSRGGRFPCGNQGGQRSR